jgi:hypothetical protein
MYLVHIIDHIYHFLNESKKVTFAYIRLDGVNKQSRVCNII